MVTWLRVSRPGVKQYVRGVERWNQKAEVRWGFGTSYGPLEHAYLTYFFQLGPRLLELTRIALPAAV